MKIPNRDGMKGRNTDRRYTYEKRFVIPFEKVLCAGCYVYEPIEVGATHACDLHEGSGKRLAEYGWKGEFKIGDVRNLPYEDKEMDCVCCCEVLEHLENMDDVKKAISEILRVGKNFLISIPFENDVPAASHNNVFNEEILKTLFPEGTHIFVKRPFMFASNKENKSAFLAYEK